MQFCLELAFGVLVALAFVPRAPVGRLFYRVMGTTAVAPVLVALAIPIWQSGELQDPVIGFAALAVLAHPVYSGYSAPIHDRRLAIAVGLSLVGVAGGVWWIIQRNAELAALESVLVTASALATGAVAGSVGLAMVLGHWYLTVPKLEVRFLQKLNRVTLVSMVLSAVLIAVTCVVFRASLSEGVYPLFGPTGLFYLGTRLVTGLAFPIAFSFMAASALRFQNTRSATGILYASTVLVLIGTAVSVSLQDSYGVPL